MLTTKRASLDRIEEGMLVIYTEDDCLYTLPAKDFPGFSSGEAVELSFDGDTPVFVSHLAEETKKNEKKNRSLFLALFSKKKR